MGLRDALEYMDDRQRVRTFSWAAGLFFAFGWWLFIDAVSQNNFKHDPLEVKAQLYLMGVGTTLSFLMISFMDWSALGADEYSHHGGVMVRYQTQALFGFALVLDLVCLIFAIHVLSAVYVDKKGIDGVVPDDVYPGVAIFFQCFFVVAATVVMRIGRVNDDYW